MTGQPNWSLQYRPRVGRPCRSPAEFEKNCTAFLTRSSGALLYWEEAMLAQQIDKLIEGLSILVADPNPHMRKLSRMMLMNIGAKSVWEAADGLAAGDAI